MGKEASIRWPPVSRGAAIAPSLKEFLATCVLLSAAFHIFGRIGAWLVYLSEVV